MAQCLGRWPAMGHRPKEISVLSEKRTRSLKLGIRSCHVQPENAQKVLLVAEVKKRLDKEHSSLPLGKHGRDDEEMIFWFLKDRRFSVEEAVFKLSKAIAWRQEFGVSSLSAENIKRAAETGKAYVHEQLDIHDRPVLIVTVAKHFPGEVEVREDEELCTFLIEKALSKLQSGKDEILVLIDLRVLSWKMLILSSLHLCSMHSITIIHGGWVKSCLWMLRLYSSLFGSLSSLC